MSKRVCIYGAGIAGLTIAHELAMRGYIVEIYEKDSVVGGMAKSKRKNNIPTEHSWRGYAPFYHNTFDILKQIPYKSGDRAYKSGDRAYKMGDRAYKMGDRAYKMGDRAYKMGDREYSKEEFTNEFTLEEIKRHVTKEDLWTYYKGDVYDITKFVSLHPGGSIILEAGGKDLEEVWKRNGVLWHKDDKSILTTLSKYKIGKLKNNEHFENITVKDTLKNINFTLLKQNNHIKGIDMVDYPYLMYMYLKAMTSCTRKTYYKQLFLNKIKGNVTDNTYDYLVNYVSGPGFGFDINTISLGHHAWFVEKQLTAGNRSWQVMSRPTNEAWFEPWIRYLNTLGVTIYTNSELQRINYDDGKVVSCIVKQGNTLQEIKGDEYCVCINPYNAIDVFERSNMKELHQTFTSIKTSNAQIGFYIAFNKKIAFPKETATGIVLLDSPFNITFYSQDQTWDSDVSLNVDSLWSGTCIMPYNKSTLYDIPGINLTREQFANEIVAQIFNSESLKQYIKQHNPNLEFAKNLVHSIEIYDEWKFTNSHLESDNKKWVNNIRNETYRPTATTNFTNLYLGGAHIKTSINVWSMEGAVESGKIVSNHILKKYNSPLTTLFTHTSPFPLNALQNIDNILYNFNLPNIIDVLVISILIFYVLKLSKV